MKVDYCTSSSGRFNEIDTLWRRHEGSQNDDKEPWEAVILSFRKWKSAKQVFNLSVVSIQHNFFFFAHLRQFFFHIYSSHTQLYLHKTEMDWVMHGCLPSRVNVINVHDYNAELQRCLNVCDCFLMGWETIRDLWRPFN